MYGYDRRMLYDDGIIDRQQTLWLISSGALIKFRNEEFTPVDIGQTGVEESGRPSALYITSRPNPFNPTAMISFTLPEAGKVRLIVYDITGRKVAVLTNGFMASGDYDIQFDGTGLASGVYFVRLVLNGSMAVEKMTLIK